MSSFNKVTHQRGFGLVELMIVLVILSVALAVGLPAFDSLRLSTKLRNYSNEMMTSVYLARSEAIKRNGAVVLCASSDGATCAASGGWEQGWVVLDPGSAVIGAQEEMSSGFKFAATEIGTSTGVTSITFAPSGLVTPASNLVLCQQAPRVGHKEKVLTLLATGRTRVQTTTNAAC